MNYTEGLAVGYKWYEEKDITPLYAFGYGLSYTSFSYRDLSVRTTKQGIEVSYEVTDTGRRAGTDTGQVYVTLPKAAGEPGKRLAAFRQVELRPGQHKRIKVTIARTASDHPLSIWDTHKDAWVTPSGTYTVEAGSSSADLLLKKSVTFR
ncbi:fibronectin type III-like domain-contianing protein [Streptomyces sp. NPDC102279]